MPVQWERPTITSYDEDALMWDFAAAALASPIFLDAPPLSASPAPDCGRRQSDRSKGRR